MTEPISVAITVTAPGYEKHVVVIGLVPSTEPIPPEEEHEMEMEM